MKLGRIIVGPILSVVFLLSFVYVISGLQVIILNYAEDTKASQLLGSLSDSTNLTKTSEADEFYLPVQSAISVRTDLLGGSEVLISENAQRKLSIASISKLMTALVVIENYDLSERVKISETAINQTVNLGQIKSGEIFFTEDLLNATLIGSDNTASYALSEVVGTENFVSLMNTKAKELNLFDTSFSNPTGLNLGNYSTAQDLVKFAEYLLKNYPNILQITKVSEFDLYTVDQRISHNIVNTDALLQDSSDLAKRIVGGKTGETRTAGGCLLLITKTFDDKGYLINIILGSDDRFNDMKKMINWVDAL